jgi:outer membrane protein OmpA-like peptidoglycan-associated protein
MNLELGAHTDSRASTAYNLKLSQRRAESAVKYIIQRGVSNDRIKPKGYGESQLINECADGVDCPEDMHQQNRRTEFKIIKINAE